MEKDFSRNRLESICERMLKNAIAYENSWFSEDDVIMQSHTNKKIFENNKTKIIEKLSKENRPSIKDELYSGAFILEMYLYSDEYKNSKVPEYYYD